MTNIVASIVVSIVTNTTQQIHEPPRTAYGCLVFGCTEDHNKQDLTKSTKTVVTTCKEITVLRFDWNGPREIKSEKVLWETNVVLKLEWK